MQISTEQRVLGCLLGGAVGDALGAPVEFLSLTQIRECFGPDGILDYAPAYGGIGTITDDTQMTLWTAEGLLRHEAEEREDSSRGRSRSSRNGAVATVHRAYLRWLKTQGMESRDDGFNSAVRESPGWLLGVKELHSCRAPGNTCLSALVSPGMGTPRNPKNDSKGCGGVMRVAPVGLYAESPERAFDLACEIAALTHGHPTGYLASGCLAALIAELLGGTGLREAVERAMGILVEKPEHEETTGCLQRALALADNGGDPMPEAIEQIGAGWIAEEALAISVHCALAHPEDFASAVLLAVNHSGDSDSTGAITGNILGALLGQDTIPDEWLDRLELRQVIETVAKDMCVGCRDDGAWRARYTAI